MPETGYIAVFLVGLLGGVHCAAMCGGIVSALTAQMPVRPTSQTRQTAAWHLHLAYNIGRIFSYTLAGAVMGTIGSLGLLFDGILPVQMALYVVANLMLVALGLYLTGLTQALAFTERLGQKLWAKIQPLTGRFLPAQSVSQALPLGMLWGWLPCGMVYSVLTTALVSGSAGRGAGLMLAFGLGTLPNLLLAGMLLKRLRDVTRARTVRLVSGLLVLGFGVFGLANATTLGGRLWQGIVCHV
ncbi:MAG: sulfite exporter TauE/SafE family protein [Proteobacteria bacterium]|nr:sulfite exporter TauE/SafE family protein [Pseudomonadota bacterium]